MVVLFHSYVILLVFVFSSHIRQTKSQPFYYCQRALGIFNEPGNASSQCFSSSSYDLMNCCFQCTISQGGAIVTRCGSLYNYNVGACSQDPGVLAQAESDCGGTNFQCQCVSGSDTSQVFGTSLPTATPTATNQPTSDTNSIEPTNSANKQNFTLLFMVTIWAIIVSFLVCI